MQRRDTAAADSLKALDPEEKRPMHRSKLYLYSITSSARV
jgi:hypothetical protein